MLHSLCTNLRPIKTLPPTEFALFLHKFSTNNTMQFSKPIRAETTVHQVPGFCSEEIDRIAEQTFRRYTAESLPKRKGKGVAIVWFRNDLRVLDNEALLMAWVSSEAVLPVYCVDPRLFSTTRYFGFPKTGGLRAQFLIECLADLKKNLMKLGLDLLIQNGKPEEILPSLAKAYGVHTVYAQKETCSEELNVERLVSKSLQKVVLSSSKGQSVKPNSTNSTKLELIWGSSMYHIDDLPFSCNSLPDVYTQFRKSVESKSKVRSCIKIPTSLGPAPSIKDWGCIPEITVLGLEKAKVGKGLAFVGGESAAVSRVCEYFWTKNLLRTYKETRNGMLGPDYSTKFSPWLASGSLSPRFIYEEVKRFERERESNDSTYWVLFELIWRDYFRFLSIKQGNSIFHAGGPRKVEANWSQNPTLFDAWRNGQTGYPLIDANMKELLTTGFMSNRGRQIVCSFLVRDMNIDWRMGAEWFETCLLDYDPCSNYGVGNDPREDRYFSIPKQAQNYDPEGEFVAYWLPQLRVLPKEKRHFPGLLYIKPVVALKFGNTKTTNNKTMGSGTRTTADENRWKGRKGNRTQ
ncbi:cryptochrome DASH, chloroplastic/mitochondrial isoform X3 [Olea europaea var. sylvestris]|uniref:cryptochrome DASH, chloroplastic/mitochondrial isoform X3 n=1 Tax=Olea europaea var. sylvestris TaxID=158386 RepID=UPI000C1D506F|nr:cryptochrome DASH, chloroplastic/mitochondrial isoform X3 [Olea europaea var. sylvestris]